MWDRECFSCYDPLLVVARKAKRMLWIWMEAMEVHLEVQSI
jgi:hypothetical protein